MKTLLLSAVAVAVLAGCASTRMPEAERLALYQAHAGAPVKQIRYYSAMGWDRIDDEHVVLDMRPNESWLLTVSGPCLDWGGASPILRLSSTGPYVMAKFDRILTELGYDSNVLMSGRAGGAGVLRLRAHVDLATLPPQRLDEKSRPRLEFRVGAGLEYRQFFSRDPRVGNTQQVNAQSDAHLALWQGEPFSLRASNHFLVTNDARNLEIANAQTFAPRIYDRLAVLATYRPRNGPLEIGLGESFRVDDFVQDELHSDRSLANELNLYGQLRVLPQTTVKLELRSSYVNYYNSSSIPNSAPLRIIAGASSLLLPWLGASLYLGYGNSLHFGDPSRLYRPAGQANPDVSYNNFVGGLEARLRLIRGMRLTAGWARDFFDSLFATFFSDDHLYIHYEHNLWRSLSVRANFDTYLRSYGALAPPNDLLYRAYRNGISVRKDVLVGFGAEATYRPLSWLEVGVSYSVLNDATDFGFVDGTGTPSDAAFVKHVLLFKADLAY